MKRLLLSIVVLLGGSLLLLIVIVLLFIPGSEEKITTAKTPRAEVTLKRYHYIAPPMGGDANWLYAELNWNGRHDRQLIMYTDYLVLGPITWVRPDKMVVCVDPVTIKEAEFHPKITLRAGGHTAVLHTELKGDCPASVWNGKQPL
jgi:hypothetical protein